MARRQIVVAAASAASPVTSVFGRVGAVVAVAGDYTVAPVTTQSLQLTGFNAGSGAFTGGNAANTGKFRLYYLNITP